jgi:hypothetical protein
MLGVISIFADVMIGASENIGGKQQAQSDYQDFVHNGFTLG